MTERLRTLADEARRVLGVRRLAFAIQDASLPGDPDTDLGHGSPYGTAARSLLGWLRDLGFDVLQLGPQGEISPGNTSPYDGAAFSRRSLSADLAQLAEADWGGLLSRDALLARARQRPADAAERVPYAFAWDAHQRLLAEAARALASGGDDPARLRLRAAMRAFHEAERSWLDRDLLFECLEREHPGRAWPEWGDPDVRLLHPAPGEREAFHRRREAVEAKHRPALELRRFAQFVVHTQHRAFRSWLGGLGMKVFGDLQIGLSARDAWSAAPWMLRGYRMGAPPSRTNPEGQPWGYPVFDPAKLGDAEHPGPVLRSLSERMDKVFREYDGLRIDHPHGLVCPWVYRSDDPDPIHAVQTGVRLFSALGRDDHSILLPFAIPRRDQLATDPALRPWDEDFVADLEPAQVERYALLLDTLLETAARHGVGPGELACEVLSTQPYPLARVMERHGLGRFRVTQKLDPLDPGDPYHLERAAAADWVMIGTHDTQPVWRLLETWSPDWREARARYAAERLEPRPERRAAFAERLLRDPGLLAQAMLAELFASPAQNALVFFTDLFGMTEPYNRPGTVSTENWSLRLPPTWRGDHRERLAARRALNPPLALALALRARDARPDLEAALRQEAAALAPGSERWLAPE